MTSGNIEPYQVRVTDTRATSCLVRVKPRDLKTVVLGDLQGIMLNGVSQSQKDRYCRIQPHEVPRGVIHRDREWSGGCGGQAMGSRCWMAQGFFCPGGQYRGPPASPALVRGAGQAGVARDKVPRASAWLLSSQAWWSRHDPLVRPTAAHQLAEASMDSCKWGL